MKHCLEIDLYNNKEITEKCINSDVYSQNLYAALCNNKFFYNDEEWTCSWRYAGKIVATLRNKNEDYLDWYCSGIGKKSGYVQESVVTEEITLDLMKIGWKVRKYESNI